MKKYLVGGVLAGLFLTGVLFGAEVPQKEYASDAHTLFLCHFNSPEEVTVLGGKVAGEGKFVPGKFGNGFLCEKKGAMLAFPAAGRINPDEGTIEMWVKPVVDLKTIKYPEAHAVLFYLYVDDNSNMVILYNSGNLTIPFSISRQVAGKPESCYPQAAADWKAQEWHHLACTWGKGAYVYYDGKVVASARFEKGIDRLPDKFYVGNAPWGTWPAMMVIDEMRIYDKQLEFTQPGVEW